MFPVRRFASIIFVFCALILVFLLSFFYIYKDQKEQEEDRAIILIATSFGTGTTVHDKFVSELKQGTKLDQNSTVRIFLGPYYQLFGFEGLLVPTPPDYYIFLDLYLYLSLNLDEQRALIAHEFGHVIYEPSFIDKLQIIILYELNIFNDRRMKIITKYQIRADGFSAEKTSPASMISFLNKLYSTGKEGFDYRMRMESLENMKKSKQGQ